jgi:hypothetical protein
MDPKSYYAEPFFSEPGHCFRKVSCSRHGAPTHCLNPIEFQGRLQDSTGRWHDVWSGIDHAGDLSEWKRVNASVTDISDAPKSPFPEGRPMTRRLVHRALTAP